MLIFEGGGKIGRYVGGYHDARGQQEQYVALKQPAVKTEEAAAAKAETVKRSSSKLSYKLQRELEQLPQLLEDLEAKLEALQTQVADASFFSQPHEQTQKCSPIWLLQSRSWSKPLNAGSILKR